MNPFKLIGNTISVYKDQIILYVAVALIATIGYLVFKLQHKEIELTKAKAANEKCQFERGLQNHYIEANAIDQKKKDEAYADAMAAKPKWKTKIEYVNTGNECTDIIGAIDESMASRATNGDVK